MFDIRAVQCYRSSLLASAMDHTQHLATDVYCATLAGMASGFNALAKKKNKKNNS